MEKAFIDLCISGDATTSEIDDFIDQWHTNDDPRPLHAFLGLSWEEYASWVSDPATLNNIILARSK